MAGPSDLERDAYGWQAAARAIAEAPPEAREQLRRLFASDFREPENYNPAMSDHYGQMAGDARGDVYGHMLRGGAYLPISAISLAEVSPYGRGMRNFVNRLFGWGGAGLAAAEFEGARRASAREGTASRHQADYQAGGRTITPEELAEMFRPRPPMSR